jgi:tetratricopeptide (TPR) repeat protein
LTVLTASVLSAHTACTYAGVNESAQDTNTLIKQDLDWINCAHQLKLTPIQVGKLWAELGYAYQDLMRYSDAEAAYTHSLAVLEREPANAGDYSATLSNLGSLYVLTGRLDAAERMDIRALEVAQRLGDRLRLAHAEGQLSEVYLQEHKLKKAAEYSLKASEDFKQTPDGGGDNRALALQIYAYATCYNKRCDEGLRSAQQAVELLRADGKPNESIALGQAYIALGFAEQQTGANAKAGNNMREGVRMLEQLLRPGDPALIAALEAYREYLAANHNDSEAAEIAAREHASAPPDCTSCTINVRGLR